MMKTVFTALLALVSFPLHFALANPFAVGTEVALIDPSIGVVIGQIRKEGNGVGTMTVVFFERNGRTLPTPVVRDDVPAEALVPTVSSLKDLRVGDLLTSTVPREDGKSISARVELIHILANGIVILSPVAADDKAVPATTIFVSHIDQLEMSPLPSI